MVCGLQPWPNNNECTCISLWDMKVVPLSLLCGLRALYLKKKKTVQEEPIVSNIEHLSEIPCCPLIPLLGDNLCDVLHLLFFICIFCILCVCV